MPAYNSYTNLQARHPVNNARSLKLKTNVRVTIKQDHMLLALVDMA